MLAKYLAATAVIAIAYTSGYTVGKQQGLAAVQDRHAESAKVIAKVSPSSGATIEPQNSVPAPQSDGSDRKTYHVSPNPWGGFTVEEGRGDPRVSKMQRIGGG